MLGEQRRRGKTTDSSADNQNRATASDILRTSISAITTQMDTSNSERLPKYCKASRIGTGAHRLEADTVPVAVRRTGQIHGL